MTLTTAQVTVMGWDYDFTRCVKGYGLSPIWDGMAVYHECMWIVCIAFSEAATSNIIIPRCKEHADSVKSLEHRTCWGHFGGLIMHIRIVAETHTHSHIQTHTLPPSHAQSKKSAWHTASSKTRLLTPIATPTNIANYNEHAPHLKYWSPATKADIVLL